MVQNWVGVIWNIFFRTFTGAAGVGAGLFAIWLPLIAYWDEAIEAESARQYHFQTSYWGFIGYWSTVLISAGFFAFASYVLLRLSLKRRRSNERTAIHVG